MFESDFVRLSVARAVTVLLCIVFCFLLLGKRKLQKCVSFVIITAVTLESTILQHVTPYVARYGSTDVSEDRKALKKSARIRRQLTSFNGN
jgi:hypothetical protein